MFRNLCSCELKPKPKAKAKAKGKSRRGRTSRKQKDDNDDAVEKDGAVDAKGGKVLAKTLSDPLASLGDRGALAHVKKSILAGTPGGDGKLAARGKGGGKGRAKTKAGPDADLAKHLLR